jgi:hypothetical protein
MFVSGSRRRSLFASRTPGTEYAETRTVQVPLTSSTVTAEEVRMADMVDVTIPVDPDAARARENPARREAAGRYLSDLLKRGGLRHALAEAIADAKLEARANGLTDDDIDTELEAWRSERRG